MAVERESKIIVFSKEHKSNAKSASEIRRVNITYDSVC
jgi:hypothetical protein